MSSIQRHEVLQMMIAARRFIAAPLGFSTLAAVFTQRFGLDTHVGEHKSILYPTRLRNR